MMGRVSPFLLVPSYRKSVACFFLIVAGALCLVQAHDGVLELTTSSFDTATSNKRVLLELYATWCTHCRKFEAGYAQVAQTLAEDGITVARVEGSANRILTQRFKVAGFPSFYYLEDGRVWEYNGERTVEALVGFARSHGLNHGSEVKGFTAPFGPYWKFTAVAIQIVHRIVQLMEDKVIPIELMLALGALTIVLLLASFVVCIHFATKPVPRIKQN